jgi:hypothetical protein
LAELTAELLRDFIITKLLPGLLKNIAIHDEQKELLCFYKENLPAILTVRRWMQRLGYKYCTQKKSFYVDDHKRAKQRFHRKEFTEEYSLKLEPNSHRWLQVSKAQLDMWFTDKEINFDQ